ncbi:hypothetical protein HEP87_00590 [Streptomyces sp. S1D4-11]|nr:hypothetical protein [Streptomyces sp. S1D4-11]QIY93008.1 hypothetical protein HEP87_00590 [Streptomyces sp. S1D4-11]
MLRFRSDDEWFFEVTGYLQNWSVRAARDAIAVDTDLLLPLLDDPDPAVRIATAYALAAASPARRTSSPRSTPACSPSMPQPYARAWYWRSLSWPGRTRIRRRWCGCGPVGPTPHASPRYG